MPGDYLGATFYLSNLGMFSVVHSFDAVLPLGAAAILCAAAADGEPHIAYLAIRPSRFWRAPTRLAFCKRSPTISRIRVGLSEAPYQGS